MRGGAEDGTPRRPTRDFESSPAVDRRAMTPRLRVGGSEAGRREEGRVLSLLLARLGDAAAERARHLRRKQGRSHTSHTRTATQRRHARNQPNDIKEQHTAAAPPSSSSASSGTHASRTQPQQSNDPRMGRIVNRADRDRRTPQDGLAAATPTPHPTVISHRDLGDARGPHRVDERPREHAPRDVGDGLARARERVDRAAARLRARMCTHTHTRPACEGGRTSTTHARATRRSPERRKRGGGRGNRTVSERRAPRGALG